MSTQRIYVGNLPFSARAADVEQLFATYGNVVAVALPTDRETGRARGFGFVEMSAEDAGKAIDALNGRDFGGRALTVNIARERTERAPRNDDRGGPRDFRSTGYEPRRYGYSRR